MCSRAEFIAEHKAIPVTLAMPGGHHLTVQAEPEVNKAYPPSCRWTVTTKTLVVVGGQAFDADVTVTVRIPASKKWRS
jgi:hypothetical protein